MPELNPADVLESIETLELPDTPEKALVSALTPKFFNGKKLEPFSLMRQSFSISLGATDNTTDRFSDAVFIVWLCTLTEWQVSVEMRSRELARIHAFAWATEAGISLTNYEPLFEMYKLILAEIYASTQAKEVIEGNNGNVEKNGGRQPVN